MKDGWKFFIGLGAGVGVVVIVMMLLLLSSGISFGNKIAVINIRGTITSSPSFLIESITPDDLFSLIKKAEDDPSVKGILFEINSPGGSVVASREIAYAVKNMEKPTLCWMGDIAASGAYWVASSCDYIMSDPLSLTGSIGVTASYLEFSKLFEKYGVTYEQITSGERKDIGSPFRNLTEEEREKIEYLTSEIFDYFLRDIVANRGLTETQVEQITSGDIFLGKDAIGLGLIDSVGTIQDAKEKAEEMAGTEQADFVTLKKKGIGLFDLLGML
ncbi:MAG: signal peptide peptidase SppA [Candidatus Aenigmarchaeota archaeon]